jgi:hypothetical protein
VAEIDERLARQVADLYRSSAPPGAEVRARLMDRVRSTRPPRRRAPGLGWWLRPREFSLPPLAWAAAALVLLVLGGSLAWVGQRLGRSPGSDANRVAFVSGEEALHVVQFALETPGASRVALVGDFNGWDPQASPMRRHGDTWVLSVPVTDGRHVYAFVVDGRHWLSDPAAPLAPEDEFGFRSSVLVVGGAGSL